MRKVFLLSVVAMFCIGLTGCAMKFTPAPSPKTYSLNNFSTPSCTVVVNDMRQDGNDGLDNIIRQQVLAAMVSHGIGSNYKIVIDILTHESTSGFASWSGKTLLNVSVTDGAGKVSASFQAMGDSKKFNLGGYGTAESAGQESYNAAIDDLMIKLAEIKTN